MKVRFGTIGCSFLALLILFTYRFVKFPLKYLSKHLKHVSHSSIYVPFFSVLSLSLFYFLNHVSSIFTLSKRIMSDFWRLFVIVGSQKPEYGLLGLETIIEYPLWLSVIQMKQERTLFCFFSWFFWGLHTTCPFLQRTSELLKFWNIPNCCNGLANLN